MAKINVRKETGCLYFDFRYKGKRCREQTTLRDTKANRKKMLRVLEKIEQAIVEGTFDYAAFFPDSKRASEFSGLEVERAQAIVHESRSLAADTEISTPSFRDFVEVWLEQNKIQWRKNTYKTNTSVLNKHLLPEFGASQVHSITRDGVMGFRARLGQYTSPRIKKPLSAKTINEIMGVLRSIMTEASIRYGFTNPCQDIKRLKLQRNHVEPLSLVEVEKFLNAVRKDYRIYFLVRFFTGMRSGEVHGLKWKNVDFDRKEILVRETWTQGRLEYTKNDGSQREIDLSDIALNALREQQEATGAISEFVFCNSNGQPLDIQNINTRIWKPTLRIIGLEERRLYQTRHTAATLWLAAGESPEWIAKQMGHTTTAMLFRTYSRYVPNLTRNDGSAFEKLLEGRWGVPS